MALVLITHNMGVVSRDGAARRGDVRRPGDGAARRRRSCSPTPQHPYTAALLAAMPERSAGGQRLATIPGVVPGVFDRPAGCLFAPRCAYATGAFAAASGPSCAPWQGGQVRCHYPLGDPQRERERIAPRRAPRAPQRGRSRMSERRRRSAATCAQVYAIRRGLFREPAHAAGGRRRVVRHRRRHDAGRGRRIGLRQVDARAHGGADREAHRRHADARRHRCGRHAAAERRGACARSVQMVFQNPYGSLNPRKKIGAILEAPLDDQHRA